MNRSAALMIVEGSAPLVICACAAIGRMAKPPMRTGAAKRSSPSCVRQVLQLAHGAGGEG
jgi:hypothetical protein